MCRGVEALLPTLDLLTEVAKTRELLSELLQSDVCDTSLADAVLLDTAELSSRASTKGARVDEAWIIKDTDITDKTLTNNENSSKSEGMYCSLILIYFLRKKCLIFTKLISSPDVHSHYMI